MFTPFLSVDLLYRGMLLFTFLQLLQGQVAVAHVPHQEDYELVKAAAEYVRKQLNLEAVALKKAVVVQGKLTATTSKVRF